MRELNPKRGFFIVSAVIFVVMFFGFLHNESVTNSNVSVEPKIKDAVINSTQEVPEKSVAITAKSVKEKFNSSYLDKFTDEQRNLYINLSDGFYRALAFSTKEEFDALIANGLPSIGELKFIEENGPLELEHYFSSYQGEYPNMTIEGHPELNILTTSNIALLRAIEEFETVINYYKPNYNAREDNVSLNDFPNAEWPAIVKEKMDLAIKFRSINHRRELALDYLARAKFEELVNVVNQGKNEENVVKFLSYASHKLGGNKAIEAYIKTYYPNQIAIYADLLNKNLEE